MQIKSLRFSSTLSFVLLTVLFFALIVINNASLQGIRFDLTENKLYTLSDGTINILQQINDPITVYLFFSEDTAGDYPNLKNYYGRVQDMLEEYRQHANGQLSIQYLDPEPFSEEEDRAAQMGLKSAAASNQDSLYFGIAATNVLDDVEVIPFLQQNREVFLEYELSKLIYTLTRLKKPVLGLMTSLAMYPTSIDPATGKMNEPWLMTQQLEQLFDVRLMHADTEAIDDDIDVLMLVHPKSLEENTYYAIDQFIMRGGKGLFFVDSYANIEPSTQPAGQPMANKNSKSSSLNRLFETWGFSVAEDTLVADPRRALSVSLQTGETIKHPAVLSLQGNDLDTQDVVMEGLQKINTGFASHVQPNDSAESKPEILPLISTTKQAGLLALDLFRAMPHPSILKRQIKTSGESYAIAARINGNFKSNFDSPPEGITNTQHLTETDGEGNLVVIADADMLSDQMWAQTQRFFGQRIIQPLASNRDFVMNLVDNLFGNSDLIGIRSRASFSRPFTKVSDIEQLAEKKYRATEESLNQEYNKVNQRLKKLQEQRPDKNNIILTREQQTEINAVKQKMIEVRKKLRNVRHQQVQDIESLGTRLKIINIGVVPGIVILIALIVFVLRTRKRRQDISA